MDRDTINDLQQERFREFQSEPSYAHRLECLRDDLENLVEECKDATAISDDDNPMIGIYDDALSDALDAVCRAIEHAQEADV